VITICKNLRRIYAYIVFGTYISIEAAFHLDYGIKSIKIDTHTKRDEQNKENMVDNAIPIKKKVGLIKQPIRQSAIHELHNL